MSVGMYLLAGGIGFAFGALVAFGNAQITRRAVEKDSTNAVMAGSMLRMLVNIAALAVVSGSVSAVKPSGFISVLK